MRLHRTERPLVCPRCLNRLFIASFVRLVTTFLVIFFSAGCDRPSALVALPAPKAVSIAIQPLAQLQIDRPTHLAADGAGVSYWVQETPDGHDSMFALAPDNQPQLTLLNSQTILNALLSDTAATDSNDARTATGNIQSIVVADDNAVYFYFAGGTRRIGLEALGRFDPRTQTIRILATRHDLMAAAEMNRAIDVARGKLIAFQNARTIRLFLHHADGWALLDLDAWQLPFAGDVRLNRTILHVRIGDKPVDLSDDSFDLCAAPSADSSTSKPSSDRSQNSPSTMLLIDRHLGAVYSVDDVGNAVLAASLVMLPASISEPAIDFKTSEAIFFAAEGVLIDPPIAARPDPAGLETTFPALLRLNLSTGKFTALDRDTMHAPGEFATRLVRLNQLIATTNNSFVGYDRASGEILSLRLQ